GWRRGRGDLPARSDHRLLRAFLVPVESGGGGGAARRRLSAGKAGAPVAANGRVAVSAAVPTRWRGQAPRLFRRLRRSPAPALPSPATAPASGASTAPRPRARVSGRPARRGRGAHAPGSRG